MAIEKNNEEKMPKEILPEEVELQAQDMNPSEDVDIQMLQDGGAIVDFDPQAGAMQGAEMHNANLAEFIDEGDLVEIASEVLEAYDECASSRDEWEQTYKKGLDLLGFKYEDRSEPFQGASGATHPVLAEAVTQFQALAYKELMPASGPVRTQIIGLESSEKVAQAHRVKEFMNYQLMVNMKEYEPEFDQMLFNLPLSGSTFKKVYYDAILTRSVSKFVPAEDLYVPFTATSLDDTETIIHKIKMTTNDIRQHQLAGIFKDVEMAEEGVYNKSDIEESKDRMSGVEPKADDVCSVLEAHMNLEIPGYEDIDPKTNESTGIKFPYIVTVKEDTAEVLSIKRNWNETDLTKKRQDYFVHFKFLPGVEILEMRLCHYHLRGQTLHYYS